MDRAIKDICVIGIGRFGTAVVKQLIQLNKHVLAVDIDENNLKEVSRLAHVKIADAKDIESLKEMGITLFETVIVATSENIEIVASLIELGVKNIIAKAISDAYERVLKLLGADIIIRPEYEAGVRAALIATNTSFVKYSKSLQEIGDGYAIGSTSILNKQWINKQLKDLKFADLHVSVVSIRRGSRVILPAGNVKLNSDDLITIVGKISNIVNTFDILNQQIDFLTKIKKPKNSDLKKKFRK